jgi:hypothetical protein
MKKLTALCAFVAIAAFAFSQNIIRGEYFIDIDPGFGNASGFEIAVPDSDYTKAVTVPYTSFTSPGYHNLFIRTLDENGKWSHTSRSIVEAEENSSPSQVIKIEYFFSDDKGFGYNSIMPLAASIDNTWDFNIPFDQLPTGWKANDSLFVRVQEGAGNHWSQTTFVDSLNFTMVGIDEFMDRTGISVYPNPFTDLLSVSFMHNANRHVVLYNSSGQLVYDKKMEKSGLIHTGSLEPGVYVIGIYADNEKLFGTKIIKYRH